MFPKEAVVEVVVVAADAIEFCVFVLLVVLLLRLVLLVQLVVFADEAVLVVVDAKSNVVESTANSVGEPTRSNVIDDDEALEAAPDTFELRLLAVEVTELANILCCCWEASNFW